MEEHDKVPDDPKDMQEFECTHCGYRAVWDEENKEWFS